MKTTLIIALLLCSFIAVKAQTPCAEPQATIIERDGSLTTDQAYAEYQWYLNGSPISGATQRTYTPTASGSYSVVVKAMSKEFEFIPTGILKNVEQASFFNLSPNPTSGQFTLTFKDGLVGNAEVLVFDIAGKNVYSQTVSTLQPQIINVGTQQKGIYFLKVVNGNAQQSIKLLID